MYIYIDTIKIVKSIMLIGLNNFFKFKDISREELDQVLHGNLQAPLLTYIRVADSLNMSLGDLVFIQYDEERTITINGIIKDDTPIPY